MTVKKIALLAPMAVLAAFVVYRVLQATAGNDRPGIEANGLEEADDRWKQQSLDRSDGVLYQTGRDAGGQVGEPVRGKTDPEPAQTAATEKAISVDSEAKVESFGETARIAHERFAKLEERFAAEPKDQTWAKAKEGRVRSLFQDANQQELLLSVQCRSTLCRLEVRMAHASDFFTLLQLPGLREEISPESVTLPHGPPSDRTAVSYFARSGYTIDRLSTASQPGAGGRSRSAKTPRSRRPR